MKLIIVHDLGNKILKIINQIKALFKTNQFSPKTVKLINPLRNCILSKTMSKTSNWKCEHHDGESLISISPDFPQLLMHIFLKIIYDSKSTTSELSNGAIFSFLVLKGKSRLLFPRTIYLNPRFPSLSFLHLFEGFSLK